MEEKECDCRVPNGNALLLIRKNLNDYSIEQKLMGAYIDGFMNAVGDHTKLILKLGRDNKEFHKIVSAATKDLRALWDKEYNTLVDFLNSLE